MPRFSSAHVTSTRLFAAVGACLLTVGLAGCASSPSRPNAQNDGFFSAWSAPQGRLAEQAPKLDGGTVRVVVRPTIDGTAVRIKLENTIAKTAVVFSSAYIGKLDRDAALVAGTNQRLTFGGEPRVTLAPGAGVYSDAIDFPVQAFERLAVSLDVVTATDISTHALGLASNFYAQGHHAQSESGADFKRLPAVAQGVPSFPVYWVAALDVKSATNRGTIVALGDSITDGRCSTSVGGKVLPDVYQRWTDVLADRLARLPASYPKAVVNAGIAGNRVLEDGPTGPSALDRFERDVLDRAGVSHVIVFEGTNDIHRDSTPAELIKGMQQLIDRAHARGLKIIGATVIPRGRPEGKGEGFDATKERYRLEVNDWIRRQARFDGVIDFDAVMVSGAVSPTGAQIMKQEYSCDFIHANAAGYRALGESIDLQLFAR